ncbi:ATP-dependent DNA helicase RecG [Lactovum miscens]|uniref:ATP-dependent DNA helicase RecG n=1 Tax=Lactovum miscens TaxID=190387 RepID=A0A841C6T6_9LACT|nr:ATP-dependent DNA helicase RecG [Lactovum miscens]MBB5887312.1 ATP-dependent DNA helicase RecG [Lactovum miscens]
MNLTDSIQYLKGVGPKSFENYKKLGIFTVEDLLLYFPFRYEDIAGRNVVDLLDGEKATIVAEIVTPANLSYFGARRSRLTFKAKQDNSVFGVSFFNQPYLKDKLEVGSKVGLYGKWDSKKQQLLGLKVLSSVEGEHGVIATDADFQPIYHVMQGVKQSSLVRLIQTAFEGGALELLQENLPQELLRKYRLISRQQAVKAMHFPVDLNEHKQALRREKFEELFIFQLRLQALKDQEKSGREGLLVTYDKEKVVAKESELPFELTSAQKFALQEILADMISKTHMNRLLQGDVGSGKTVVAELSMYAAYTAGFQSALMVPTEILARQHFANLTLLFPELQVSLLVSAIKASERREILEDLATGHTNMVVGTHALIQDGVEFDNLGLVITDEQHRFGVNQRKILREKGQNPDVLMMTATPIPRTLAITAFGDMDVSVIDELPAGRKPITTRWVKHQQIDEVLKWVRTEILKEKAQIYVISPLIEESEALDLKNAQDLYEELSDYFKADARIGLLHGQMKADEKEERMAMFKAGKLDLLVSTTVIEVGVDVQNATIMIIMDADRFGLSQLHQLRGRVGRGQKKSYCILVANPKSESGKQRMQIMVDTTDGFKIAEEDLKMRGSGEVFGIRQSGIPEFTVADLVNDYNILEVAREEAIKIFADSDGNFENYLSSFNFSDSDFD